MMDKSQIRRLAIQCGFKEREQEDGAHDMNAYVYEFARALIAAEREACAKVCEDEICACCWEDGSQAVAEHLADLIRDRSNDQHNRTPDQGVPG